VLNNLSKKQTRKRKIRRERKKQEGKERKETDLYCCSRSGCVIHKAVSVTNMEEKTIEIRK